MKNQQAQLEVQKAALTKQQQQTAVHVAHALQRLHIAATAKGQTKLADR